MKNFENIDDILDFAINEEQKAIDFYAELVEKATTEDVKAVFMDFVKEEISHKQRLQKIKVEKQYEIATEKVTDLKIADYLVHVEIGANMSYQDALVLAMKKEKAAFKLYMILAERADNSEMKDLFMGLAQEESKHKLKFEIEYDEYILREN